MFQISSLGVYDCVYIMYNVQICMIIQLVTQVAFLHGQGSSFSPLGSDPLLMVHIPDCSQTYMGICQCLEK